MTLAVVAGLCAGCDLGGSSGGGGSTDSYSSNYDSLVNTSDPSCDSKKSTADKGEYAPPASDYGDEDLPVAHAPEPATLTLLGLGIVGLVLRRRRRSR